MPTFFIRQYAVGSIISRSIISIATTKLSGNIGEKRIKRINERENNHLGILRYSVYIIP